MDYDVLVLGGGLIGCATAYELSKYSLNIALIEKDYDIADDISLINTAVVYDGIENDDNLMSSFENKGNELFDQITNKFNVPFKRLDTLIFSLNDKNNDKVNKIYNSNNDKKIKNISLLNDKQIYDIKKSLGIDIKNGICTKNTGVVCPYDLAISYGEIAFDNGVKFKLEEEVLDIEKLSRGYKVTTNKNKFTCKMVINTTSTENYSFDLNKKHKEVSYNGNVKYLLLDKDCKINLSHILFLLSDNDEKILVVPTLQDNIIVGMYSKETITYTHFISEITKIFKNLDDKYVRNFYKADFYEDKVYIEDDKIDNGYISIYGKNYSQVTMAPFISKKICDMVVKKLKCKLNKDFNGKRREFYKFRDLTDEERNNLIKVNSKYGKMICYCQCVTEGEIVDSIRRPLGARTLEGIKRRTGAACGSCQGSNCINKIVSILAREINRNVTDIVKDSKDSKIVLGRVKEFNEM